MLPGVELSVGRRGGRLHLLGYLHDTGPEPLATTVASLRRVRAERAGRILERLAARGVVLDLARRRAARARPDRAGRTSRPRWSSRGYADTLQDAFDRHLADEHGVSEPVGSLGPEEAIGLIRASGGVPVLAHPWTLGLDVGGAARRARSRGAPPASRASRRTGRTTTTRSATAALMLAAELDLVATGGSDFHRPEAGLTVGNVGPRAGARRRSIAALGL